MKRLIRFFTVAVLMLSLMIQVISIPLAKALEEGSSVTILFTHDMHSNFLPFKAVQEGGSKDLGGYARLQSAINYEKAIDGEALLLDAGDYSMGTPFQTIYSSSAPELRIMGQMGYDVVTLGNHEFDYRPEGLTDSLYAAINSGDRLPLMVQSNMTFPLDEKGNLTASLTDLRQALEAYGLKDYIMLERNGVNIGIFGLMGKESADRAPMSEVVFEDELKYAKQIVKILEEQEKAELIICLSHSGTSVDKDRSEDEILAKEVPEIDVIISGHTHTKLQEPIIIGDTIIGSSEENGMNLGVMKVIQQSGSWELEQYNLIAIDDSLPEDAGIAALVADYKEIVQEEYFSTFGLSYDEVVAVSPFDFPSQEGAEKQHDESTLGNLISDAYIYAVKQAEGEAYVPVDAAIVPIGTIRGSFLQGEITTADAFSVSSLGVGADKTPGYPLISLYLTGKELKAVCEVDASITPIMGDAQLYISGLKYRFNPNRLIFNKVVDCSLVRTNQELKAINSSNLEKIDDKKLYRVVAGLYSAQMLSVVGEKSFGLLKIEPKTEDGALVTNYESRIIYNSVGENKSELKEWAAIVSYLKSFDKVEGVPNIPQYYNEVQGRKVVDNDKNIIALFSNPNGIALTVYGIVLVLTILIILLTRFVIRRIIRCRRSKEKINTDKVN